MRHRHLDHASDTPVAELGPAALDDLLDRGDLDDWAPLLREIRRDPHGPVADRILRLGRDHPLYGTSRLWRAWIEKRRGASAISVGPSLRQLRVARGRTQLEVAEQLGATQPEVSKLERRGDVRLSTLRSYVEALGGSLSVVARFEDGDVELPH
jgi:hypothetical protein